MIAVNKKLSSEEICGKTEAIIVDSVQQHNIVLPEEELEKRTARVHTLVDMMSSKGLSDDKIKDYVATILKEPYTPRRSRFNNKLFTFIMRKR